MESGFGEKLRSLDEGYTSMRDYLQANTAHGNEIDDTKEKIAGEKQEIEKVVEERNKIVSDLVERAQLQKEEKEQIISQLAEKEAELESSQRELAKMNKRLFVERMRKKEESDHNNEPGLESFTETFIVREIGVKKVLILSVNGLKRRVNELLNTAPHQYIDDLERHGYFENGITRDGINLIRHIAKRIA